MTKKEAYRLAMQACEETWNEKTCRQIKKVLEQDLCEDDISKKIDEFEINGKTAEIWIVNDKLQIRCLGVIHNIPLSSVTS